MDAMTIQKSKMESRRMKEWNGINIKISILNVDVWSMVMELIFRIV